MASSKALGTLTIYKAYVKEPFISETLTESTVSMSLGEKDKHGDDKLEELSLKTKTKFGLGFQHIYDRSHRDEQFNYKVEVNELKEYHSTDTTEECCKFDLTYFSIKRERYLSLDQYLSTVNVMVELNDEGFVDLIVLELTTDIGSMFKVSLTRKPELLD